MQSIQDLEPFHALIGAMLLQVALTVLSHTAQTLMMGLCGPAKAKNSLTLAWEKEKQFSTP